MTLQEIWNSLPMKTDKGNIHSYLPVYEEILAPYRETAKNILEIGLFNGASMLLWEKYFKGTFHGIDCHLQPHNGMADLRPMLGEHNIYIMDATNAAEAKAHFDGMQFDVIIDDGSHYVEYQLKSYEIFKEYLAPNGIYIIEDIQDIDTNEVLFRTIDVNKNVEIIDRRKVKKRYDDVMVVIR